MKTEKLLKRHLGRFLYWLLIPWVFIQFTQQASAAGYLLKQGKGYAICEAFKKRLDGLGSLKEPLTYNSKNITWEIPGIKEAVWQDLDVETHDGLFGKLIRYDMLPYALQSQILMRATGRGELEVSEEEAKIDEKKVNERLTKWREEAKAGTAKLQVLRTNLVLYDDTLETIARIWRKYGEGKYEYSITMYPVTEDLQEIDLVKVGRSSWRVNLPGSDLVVYGGRHYLVEWWGGNYGFIASDFGSGLVPFCTIEFDWKAYNKEMKK